MKIIDIESISELHAFYGCEKPKHPLVTLIDHTKVNPERPPEGVFYRTSFYSVGCKRFQGTMKYGKSYYDFEEGTLMFMAPNQVVSSSPNIQIEEGWGLFFHPDLINSTELGRTIHTYSFFQYDTNEALHISEEEKLVLEDCVLKINHEYSHPIDKHSQGLIVSAIELLLKYCNRFYDRQFMTRAKINNDIVQNFERLLTDYFAQETLIDAGLPDVKYFASALNLSPNYLSDLLNKYTGKTTQEHIHIQLIERAKNLLWSTNKSVSEIAYDLGFEYASHFTKIFKAKTGMAPKEYRKVNA